MNDKEMYSDFNGLVKRELMDMSRFYNTIQATIQKDVKTVSRRKEESIQRKIISLYIRYTSEGAIYHKHEKYDGKQKSIRLGSADNEEVIRIKQRKYCDVLLRILKKNIELLEGIDGKFLPYDPDSIDGRLRPVYRDSTGLVNKAPGILDMEEWNKIVRRNSYDMPDECNIAPDGLETRSKSEIIVYGILKGYGLVVKYDMEITLIDDMGHQVAVSPDFIILCNDGSLIIIEHLGRMDDLRYLDKVIKKIHLYMINGYRLNDNLFLTADYAQGKINAQVIDELVRKMILPRVNGIAG